MVNLYSWMTVMGSMSLIKLSPLTQDIVSMTQFCYVQIAIDEEVSHIQNIYR
jgi:hypothetical protein